MDIPFPKRYTFKRTARASQFARAFIVILAGIAIIYARRFVTFPEKSPWEQIILYIGGFIAFSGAIAVLLLILALIFHKELIVEVDETGLTYSRAGKNNQSLKWADVNSYEVDTGGIVGLDWLTSPSNSSYSSSSSAGDDLFGCVLGLVFGLYLVLLEYFIGGSAQTVKFKLKSKRGLSVKGAGYEMDELIGTVLPHFLPDKRTQPGQKAPKPKKTSETPEA